MAVAEWQWQTALLADDGFRPGEAGEYFTGVVKYLSPCAAWSCRRKLAFIHRFLG
jgi:hypothetical protein